jgi:hypothetical protein
MISLIPILEAFLQSDYIIYLYLNKSITTYFARQIGGYFMDRSEMQVNLEALYVDYYDGLHSEYQLKLLLKKLYLESNIPISEWSEMVLDAQWKDGTDLDYQTKKLQISLENI